MLFFVIFLGRENELSYYYTWMCSLALPERERLGILNASIVSSRASQHITKLHGDGKLKIVRTPCMFCCASERMLIM